MLETKSKARFATARVTISRHLVEHCTDLTTAASSNDGHPITLAPLPKIYFRPDPPLKKPSITPSEIDPLKDKIGLLEFKLQQVQKKHENEIGLIKHEVEKMAECLHSIT